MQVAYRPEDRPNIASCWSCFSQTRFHSSPFYLLFLDLEGKPGRLLTQGYNVILSAGARSSSSEPNFMFYPSTKSLCNAMSLSIKFKFFMSLRQVNAVKAPVDYVFLLEKR